MLPVTKTLNFVPANNGILNMKPSLFYCKNVPKFYILAYTDAEKNKHENLDLFSQFLSLSFHHAYLKNYKMYKNFLNTKWMLYSWRSSFSNLNVCASHDWGVKASVVEWKVSNPPGILKSYENYINCNGIAYGYGCGDSVSYRTSYGWGDSVSNSL